MCIYFVCQVWHLIQKYIFYKIKIIDKTIDIDTHHSTGKMQLYINNQKKYYKNHEERVARINSFQ